MSINFGKYDQRIVIQSYAETRGADGSAVRSYSTLYTLWANVVPTGGNEVDQSDEKVGTTMIDVRVRAKTLTLNDTMRIVWRGQTYNITNIQPFGTRLNEGYFLSAVAKDND